MISVFSMIQFAVITVAHANKKLLQNAKVNYQLGVFIFISMYSSSPPNGPIFSPRSSINIAGITG